MAVTNVGVHSAHDGSTEGLGHLHQVGDDLLGCLRSDWRAATHQNHVVSLCLPERAVNRVCLYLKHHLLKEIPMPSI
jgi:hypothetical protein